MNGSVWFVTPAWRRYNVSALCFAQRRATMDELAALGVDARCVVVSDDGNLDLARQFGFDTLERDNEWLGRRFNDGIAYAVDQGAEWIVPIGSDSWVAAAYLYPLPDPKVTRTSRFYALARRGRLAELEIGGDGVGPYMIHRDRLPASGRPSVDALASGVDNSTLAGLRDVVWEWNDVHPLQYVAFRAPGIPQLHDYRTLWRRFGVREHRDGVRRLRRLYPEALVDEARARLDSMR